MRRVQWDRRLLREHGLFVGVLLLCREIASTGFVSFANRYLPARHECPCCGWRGNRFHDYFEVIRTHRNVECPRCASHPRHRALFLWIKSQNWFTTKTGVGLVFAPESAFVPIWTSASSLRVFGVDIRPRSNVNLRADLCNLPLANNSIDLQWCHHVLEHIENDRDAIRELYRVLRPVTGELILSVPTQVGTRTREYGHSNKRESGHWRIYGDDFIDRVSECGFRIEPISCDLSAEDFERYGLIREQYYVCRKADAHQMTINKEECLARG
jgi:SAM-dependent methyltransferase